MTDAGIDVDVVSAVNIALQGRRSPGRLEPNPLDLGERHFGMPTIVKLRGSGRAMSRQFGRSFDGAAVAQVVGDASTSE